jgi:hypothetical protein
MFSFLDADKVSYGGIKTIQFNPAFSIIVRDTIRVILKSPLLLLLSLLIYLDICSYYCVMLIKSFIYKVVWCMYFYIDILYESV